MGSGECSEAVRMSQIQAPITAAKAIITHGQSVFHPFALRALFMSSKLVWVGADDFQGPRCENSTYVVEHVKVQF